VPSRSGDIGAGADGVQPGGAQMPDAFAQRRLAPVQAVVSRQRDHLEARACECSCATRMRQDRMAGLWQLGAAGGEGGFQLPEGDLRIAQHSRGGGEARIRVLSVRSDVASRQNDSVHCALLSPKIAMRRAVAGGPSPTP
jgi:hypothetical protein